MSEAPSLPKMTASREIFIVAGEHSGDLIGEMFIRELLALAPDLKVTGLGGERMASAGAEIRLNLVRDLAIIGVAEVILKFPRIYDAFFGTIDYLREHRPAVLVLIDYPGFNLRLAKRAKRLGIPVVYYVTPQVWAWHRSRLAKMRDFIDLALVILPFEEKLLREAGIPARFVGSPWLDLMVLTMNREEVFEYFGFDDEKKLIGLLPGSRSREVKTHLPLMIEAAGHLHAENPNLQFALIRASSVDEELITSLLADSTVPITVVDKYRYNVRNAMDLAIVVSGTATLETGLLLCPMVILYKMSALTWFIGRNLLSIPDVGLINVVAEERIVPELVGENCHVENIVSHCRTYLNKPEERAIAIEQLGRVKDAMGGPGAGKRAAEIVVEQIEKSNSTDSLSTRTSVRDQSLFDLTLRMSWLILTVTAALAREILSVARRHSFAIFIAFFLGGLALLFLVHPFDQPAMQWIDDQRTPDLMKLGALLSTLGQLHMVPLFLVAALWIREELRGRKESRILLWSATLSMVVAGLLVQIPKFIFGRPRPYLNLPDEFAWFHPEWNSFPSGHATHWFALVGALAIFSPRLVFLTVPLAATAAIARFIVNAHYPTDLLAGMLFGLTVGLCYGFGAKNLHQNNSLTISQPASTIQGQ